MQSLTDAELVAAMLSAAAVAQAEAELFRRFATRIELYGRRHLRSVPAAKDLVQDVLVRVVEAIRGGRLENPASLASFVLGTARNATLDLRRQDQKHSRLAREAAAQAEVVAQAHVAAQTLTAGGQAEPAAVLRLMGCMGGLPGREATVVRMSFWEDRAAEEIGARLGVSAGHVRVIRHRALARLVVCMNAERAA